MVPRVDIAPHGAETPTWGSQRQRHPGRIKSNPQIRNPSINLQPQQAGVENGGPPGQQCLARCGTPKLGFSIRAGYGPNPGSEILPYIYNTNKLGTKTVDAGVATVPNGVETPTWGCQRHPGMIRSHPRIINPSIHLQLQQTGDENGGLPGRYRPAQCANPNLGFVEPAPPGEDKIPSLDQKSVHTSTTITNRGQKRWTPGSIPPRTA